MKVAQRFDELVDRAAICRLVYVLTGSPAIEEFRVIRARPNRVASGFAVEDGPLPMRWDPLNSGMTANQRADDRRVRVRIAAPIRGIQHGGLERRCVEQFPECEPERDANKPLVSL